MKTGVDETVVDYRFVNWNRVEHLANISASSYQIWYHLKLTYNFDRTNWVPVFVHSTLPI